MLLLELGVFGILLLEPVVNAVDTTAASFQQHTQQHHHHAGCLTQPRPVEELQKIQQRIKAARQRTGALSQRCRQCIPIDTHITVVQCRDGSTDITRGTVDEQFAILIQGFAQTPFTFRLSSVEFAINDLLCRNDVETTFPLASEYRKGEYDALNVFLGGAGAGSFATYPVDGALERVPFDGAFIDIETVPGGASVCCNLGKTLVHEVSNIHTFCAMYLCKLIAWISSLARQVGHWYVCWSAREKS